MVQTLGDTARALDEGEVKHLEKIIADYRHKDSYYVFKTSQWEGGNVLRSKYTMRSTKPLIPVIKSKLWKIDNRRGVVDLIWDLPADYVGADAFASNDDKYICPQAFHSAQSVASLGAIKNSVAG